MPQPISATQLAQGPGHWSGHTAACHTPTAQNLGRDDVTPLFNSRIWVLGAVWQIHYSKKVCIIEYQKLSYRIIIKRMITMMKQMVTMINSIYVYVCVCHI